MKRRNFLALFALSPVVAKGVAVGLAEEKLPLVLALGKDPWRIRGRVPARSLQELLDFENARYMEHMRKKLHPMMIFDPAPVKLEDLSTMDRVATWIAQEKHNLYGLKKKGAQ